MPANDNPIRLTDAQKEVILNMAACGLTMNKAANRMNCGRSTVFYHVREIVKRTGLNPCDFYDMLKLIEMTKEAK